MALVQDASRQSPLLAFFDANAFYPITEALAQKFNVVDATLLRGASKLFHPFVEQIMPHATDINRRLEPFVDDPVALRVHLANTGSIIGGRFVLHVLEASHSKELAIYVDFEKIRVFIDHLKERENYCADEQNLQNTGYLELTCESRPGYKIELCGSRGIGSPQNGLTAFLWKTPTSACMNFMSWNKIFSLFPRETFLCRKFYRMASRNNETWIQEIAALVAAGWSPEDEATDRILERRGDHHRRVADKDSLVIPLRSDFEKPADFNPEPDFVMEHNHFDLGGGSDAWLEDDDVPDSDTTYLDMKTMTSYDDAFRYGYTYHCAIWYEYVMAKIEEWAKDNGETRYSISTTPTITLDEHIPRWYEEWERIRVRT